MTSENGHEVDPVERVGAGGAREDHEREQLDPRRDAEADAEPDVTARDPALRDRVRADDQAEERERKRAEADGERGHERRETKPPQLQQLERGEHRREAERVRVEAGEHRRRGEHAEDARRPERRPAPLPPHDRGEEDCRCDSRDEDERQVPDERGREVVEEAVRRERVRARVPEVVPDERAVADEERPVEMDGSVARAPARRSARADRTRR